MMNNERSARDDWRDDRDKKGERIQESEIKLRVASEEENRLLQLVGRLERQLSAERDLRERAEERADKLEAAWQFVDAADKETTVANRTWRLSRFEEAVDHARRVLEESKAGKSAKITT